MLQFVSNVATFSLLIVVILENKLFMSRSKKIMQQRRIMYILRLNNKAVKYRKKKPILTNMYSHFVLSFYKNICGGVKRR